MNLQRYEEQKWKTLRKHTLEIFQHEFKQFKKELESA